jgi:hypothetical protein
MAPSSRFDESGSRPATPLLLQFRDAVDCSDIQRTLTKTESNWKDTKDELRGLRVSHNPSVVSSILTGPT